ncbi:peptidoglycan DD-metalloendopeptidase family protein [Altererythrobacter aerius]|uniref:Peptidoglycan DD-metalloendopeptidase family protein n=2 Tax=Tsuneonella aeria TaxID=1837929 RepID=A0A6I4TDU1_9SPHN|nr:peptidoglycan DD-metalloendopeptidase family protein [Tsuneonella aeria]
MRSQGQVRFIKLSARMQMAVTGIALAALVAWAASIAVMGWLQYRASADRMSLLEREAQVATSQDRVDAYRQDIGAIADDLARRQAFIEEVVDSLPADARDGETVSDSAGEAAGTVSKISALIPEASGLARVEARQIAFVERLTRYADRRAEDSARAIRRFGLDPNAMIRGADRRAMGGPLERLATSNDGSIDPRFERLGLSLARMDALERGLEGIPSYRPAAVEMLTSSFGVRRDPFTGAAAMHSGLDFRGPTGAPIYAAATGRVIFVGVKSGYGNVVEISHGNGMVTRYAHMSRFASRVGQTVEAGDVIGAIGSTGRSTGPHLHFEVRINDRAVNPRPFLEAAPHVHKEARRERSEPARG